jgi:hypothetical protein
MAPAAIVIKALTRHINGVEATPAFRCSLREQ